MAVICKDQNAYLIVYADNNYVIPDDIEWPHWSSDRPEQNRRIDVGDPICSVHVSGTETQELYELALSRSEKILSYI